MLGKRWLPIVLATVALSCASQPMQEQVAGSSQEEQPAAAQPVQGKFIHTVLFWLKEGTPEAQRQQLISDCKLLLGSISSVRYLAAGLPAGTPRDVVDNSYDVGLVVHFDDQAGHDLYQDAPAHQEFIARNQESWDRVQVYDILAD